MLCQLLLPLFLSLVALGVGHVAIHPRSLFTGEGMDESDEHCTPLVSCPAHVRSHSNRYCQTATQRVGVHCRTGGNFTDESEDKARGHSRRVHFDDKSLEVVRHHVQREMSKLRTAEINLLASRKRTVLYPGPAAFGHYRNSKTFDPVDLSQMMNVANGALELAIATRTFRDRHGLTSDQMELGFIYPDLHSTPLGRTCLAAPFCPLIPDRYRRIDGACNNALHATWGAPFTPYARLLPASYDDGVWTPRTSSVDGEPLPSPRLISTVIVSDVDTPNYEYTMALMQFGQFLSHDITQSMDMSYSNGSAISCCEADGTAPLPPEATHYACQPIEIPEDDPFFRKYGQKCMNFVRSILAPRHDCTLGYSQQMNKLTAFIDASSVYGSTPEQTGELRSFRGGKLRVFNDFGRPLLPLAKDPEACLTMERGSACFQSGDTRTNQMITLVVMHTLFLREHNRLADALAALNPHWDDERLFLEARQILTAEMQTIVYKEYLPTLLGEDTVREFGLRPLAGTEYSFDYNPLTEPAVTNEFAAAAFRFGHSMVDGHLKLYGPEKMDEVVAIPELMFYPARMRYWDFLDETLSSMTTEPIQEVDGSVTEALTKYMFRGGNPFGVDLVAINVQRGRDHGLRPFNDYRELIGLPRIADFNEFGPEVGAKLKSVYKTVDDIDLWIGGLLEPKSAGALLGPTFRDIVADQFARLKKGDRYFFENDPAINPGHLGPDQLREVRKASLSRIICDNSDKTLLKRQAPNAFRKPGVEGNEFEDCAGPAIPAIDLSVWQE